MVANLEEMPSQRQRPLLQILQAHGVRCRPRSYASRIPRTVQMRLLPCTLRYIVLPNRVAQYKSEFLPAQKRPHILWRIFDMVSIRRIENHYITVNSFVVYGCLIALRLISTIRCVVLPQCREKDWRSSLTVPRSYGENPNKISDTTVTDGISVRTHLVAHRPKWTNETHFELCNVDEEQDLALREDPG